MTPATRIRLALALLVIPCLCFSIANFLLVTSRAPGPGYVDRISKAERRYDSVRALLPSRGRVGYLMKVRSPAMLDWYHDLGIVYAQYALVPLQVSTGTESVRKPIGQAAKKTDNWSLGLPWYGVLAVWDLLFGYEIIIEEHDEGVRVIRRALR